MTEHRPSAYVGAHATSASPKGTNHPETPGTDAHGLERLLTYRECGELLGVTDRTVWSLVNQGELQAVRFGRSVRVDPADLRAYIDRCKTTATTPNSATPGQEGGGR